VEALLQEVRVHFQVVEVALPQEETLMKASLQEVEVVEALL